MQIPCVSGNLHVTCLALKLLPIVLSNADNPASSIEGLMAYLFNSYCILSFDSIKMA